MAMSAMLIVPVLVVFALGQRYFIQGVALSGLKG
jgi:multiple sugar transport system permease protein